jgi:general secretion pathway protein G
MTSVSYPNQSLTAPLRTSRLANGFTLLEMLVVLVIIGLLAGLVGPRLFSKVDESKVKTAKVQIKMLKGALETVKMDINRFPNTDEGLDILYRAPKDPKTKALWRGPYLDEEIPLDPWSNPYQYSLVASDSQPYSLFSFGPEGKAGAQENFIGYVPKR